MSEKASGRVVKAKALIRELLDLTNRDQEAADYLSIRLREVVDEIEYQGRDPVTDYEPGTLEADRDWLDCI